MPDWISAQRVIHPPRPARKYFRLRGVK
jgi:hypothetical protein